MKERHLVFSALIAALHLIGSHPSHAVESNPTYGEWFSSRIGGGGYVIDLIPSGDPKVYYLHTDVGGFYRSDDGGKNWRMLQGALPATQGSQEPRSLVVHPKDPNTILVATGSHWDKNREGIYRSTDGGKTFERTLEAPFAGNGNARMWGKILAIDPFNPDVVLVGSMKDGVFRSEDFGKTWTKVGLEDTNPSDIDFDVMKEGRVLLCSRPYNSFLLGNDKTVLKPGFFESADAGKTWVELISDANAPFEIVQAGKAFNNDWFGTFPPSVIKRSSDGGKTWKDYGEGLPDGDKTGVLNANGSLTGWGAVAPFTFTALSAGPDFLLVGSGDGKVYRRGATDNEWKLVPGKAQAPDSWFGNAGDRPGWIHFGRATATIVVDPRDPKKWWMCDWYMLWRSDDSGKVWNYSGDGLEITCLHNVTQAPDDPGLVHMGMGDNGYFRSFDGGATFQQQPKVITNNVKDIAVSPKDPARLYAIGPDTNGQWFSSQVFVSDDRGTSWRRAAMKGARDLPSRRINSVGADPNNGDGVYITVAGKPSEKGGVFHSIDAGETWVPVNDGLPEQGLFRADIWHVGREIAVSKDGSIVAIAHDPSLVFAFNPGIKSWSKTGVGIEQPNSVAADPFVPGHFLVAGLKGGLSASLDGGQTWTPAGLDVGCHHVAFDQVKKGRVAVGADDGVYLSEDSGNTWKRLDGALPNHRGNPVAFAGDRIIAGSTGAGVFWLPLTPEAAKPVQTATVTPETESGGVEVVKNGTFDTAGNENEVPEDWRLRWSDVKGRVTLDSAVFKSKPTAMNLHLDQAGYCVVEQELPADLQGKWLSFSGQTRLNGEFTEAHIAVQLMNDAGEQMAWITVFSPEKSVTNWQSFKKTISLPAQYSRAFLLYHVKGSGDVWLDDVSGQATDPR